ncbi:MAG TPA: hypothetical protein VKB19_19445 [Pedobacter sp.]|nr:hypothetical protein [Pedobacter sp.]
MKRLLAFLCCTIIISASAQQKTNTFHIVDQDTKIGIPASSVAIVRARLAINTEKEGAFSIPGNLAAMRDTVIICAQNYNMLKIQLHQLDGMDTIPLKRMGFEPVTLKIDTGKDFLINDFDRRGVAYYSGLNTETAAFEYLQLAQQFDLPKSGAILKSVQINRLAFYVDYSSQGNYTSMEYTKFRIRIYDIDPGTGGPGRDLASEIIEAKSGDSKQIKINTDAFQILIPGKTFFVAIEWLRDFHNMGYVNVFDHKLQAAVQQINYRPAIGISPVKGKKLNMWALNFRHQWKPYTYFSPDWTDLAIKAIVFQ